MKKTYGIGWQKKKYDACLWMLIHCGFIFISEYDIDLFYNDYGTIPLFYDSHTQELTTLTGRQIQIRCDLHLIDFLKAINAYPALSEKEIENYCGMSKEEFTRIESSAMAKFNDTISLVTEEKKAVRRTDKKTYPDRNERINLLGDKELAKINKTVQKILNNAKP